MRKELCGLFMILIIAGLNLPAQNPYIQHYTTVDGLPSNMVYQVCQDSRKFIWFATDAGVAKFDGSRFVYYRKHNGLNTNEVIRIKEDSSGRIWFFNLNASLNFYYQNIIYNATNAPFLDSLVSKEFFREFYEDEDKTIYFYYNHQRDIFALDSQNNVKKYKLPSVLINQNDFPEVQPFEGMVIRYLTKAATGKFYLWTGVGLFKLDNLAGELTLVSDASTPFGIYPISDTTYYLVQVNNIKHRAEIKKSNIYHLKDSITPLLVLESEFISSILADGNGFLWISTFDKGVFCYKDRKIIRHFDIKEAQALFEDHENNIWISSLKDGVFKISPYINQHFQYGSDSFQNRGIAALGNHISNGVWLTNGKTIYLLQNNDLFNFDIQKEESSFNQILHLNNRTLLVGEISTRQFALEGIQIDPLLKKVHFNHIYVSAKPLKKFASSTNGNEVSSFNHFGLQMINPDKLFEDIKVIDIGERIYNIFYNSRNELLVNGKRNYIYKNDSLKLFEDLSCFDNKFITDHLNINNTTDLFNLEGDSLYLLKGQRLYNLTSAFGYPIDLQIKYMDYHEPILFIATTRNVYTCENTLNILENKPVQLQPVDISFRNIHDILFNDEVLYIASDDGLTAIPFATIQKIQAHSPIPYIKSVQVNDEEKQIDVEHINLKGSNRIHFDLSSINYSFCPVIYSYKLEGADKEWTSGTGTDVVYQGLPRGDYIFKLRVRKPTSGWSEPVAYGISIHATFWQQPLFFVALSFIFVGLVFLFIIRRKNIQIKRREIEHQLVLLEQKALQSMMNPHFIFNTLGSIQNYLLQSKPGDAGLYLSQFARLVRQNLNAINEAVINLEEEVDRLKNYMDLEKLRLDDKFDYHIDIDRSVESEDIMIPSMIIQPFVENSIWHGIANLEEKGLISIRFSMHDDKSLEIIIEDNGIGITNAEKYSAKGEKHLKLGMQMTRKRLDLLSKKYGMKTRIEFSEKSPGSINPGTHVMLVVPFHLS